MALKRVEQIVLLSFYLKGDQMYSPYNNGTANPYYPQQTNDILKSFQNQILPGQTSEHHTVKVNGRAGAESYNLPPNSDELLLDMNNPVVWFVQTDGAGYKTVTPYDISQHKEVKQEDMLKSLEDRITKLEEEMRNGKSNTSGNGQQPHNGSAKGSQQSKSN